MLAGSINFFGGTAVLFDLCSFVTLPGIKEQTAKDISPANIKFVNFNLIVFNECLILKIIKKGRINSNKEGAHING
jgi:hypothetical protein